MLRYPSLPLERNPVDDVVGRRSHREHREAVGGSKKPGEHLVQVDDDLSARDLPSDAIAHDATLALTGAHLDGLGVPVDEPLLRSVHSAQWTVARNTRSGVSILTRRMLDRRRLVTSM